MIHPVKRIDAHQHFWKYDPHQYLWMDHSMSILKQDYLPNQLTPILQNHKMDGSIAVQARSIPQETDFLLNLAQSTSNILGVVGWIDLRSAHLQDALAQWHHQPLLKGFRHLIQDEPAPSAFLKDTAFNQGVKTILQAGKLYEIVVHEKDLSQVIQFCKQHDNGQLVLCHLGKPDLQKSSLREWRDKIAPLATLSHVSCKVSGLITQAVWHRWDVDKLLPYINTALEIFGPKRLMFGSDWPVCLCAGTVNQVYDLIEKAITSLSTTEQHAIFGGNATRIYQI
ncbi:amidohydrolase family protein [Commensalibacter oyaizuii]|uniref:Amidohydrolase family protein n=1 Tax=Commensalibacter oyaizuii TaxID=3043873 RepID=A0ABT6Q240_9PROT|nr:amidohydrolase family protein [Commensalibacter sp. TBRC 16381]MDI2091167.1 amidohydrolase family protein [Commensalibacter sp. TBRC 16381]